MAGFVFLQATDRTACIYGKSGARIKFLKETQDLLSYLVPAVLAAAALTAYLALRRRSNERRQAQEALRDSEARFRDFTALSSDWYWEQDAEFRFTVMSNGAFLNPQSTIGKTRWDLPIIGMTGADWQAHRDALERHEEFRNLVYQTEPQPGVLRWYSISGRPFFGPDGEFRGYRGTGSDITERKQAEQTLRERATQLQLIYDTANVSIFNVDTQGVITHANQRMAEMFACPMGRLIGSEYVAHIHPAERETGRQKMLALLASDIPMVSLERHYMRDDGTTFWGHLTGRQMFDADGKAVGLVGVIADVTERKRAEDALRELNETLEQKVAQRTRELEAFSYSVAHDLRSPLRAIDGFSQLVLSDNADKLDPASVDNLKRVRAAAQRLGELIDDLLELALVSRTEVSKQQVDLTLMAREIMGAIQSTQPGRDVRFSAGDGISAQADLFLARILLENLLGNAWKYTGKTAAAQIEFGRIEQGGETTYFVRDNGIGFDMAYADKLFQPFQRLHHRDDFEGSGIGLSIAQRIVHRHGGRIWVESSPGAGTTFFFTFD
jgi:PAS domain S-box-containing protein